MQPTLLL
jgi:hypothetical protein